MIKIGVVFKYINSARINKPKYYIIVGISNTSIGCVIINTEVNINFLPTNLQAANLIIYVKEHDWLDYDSTINCSELFPFNKTEINNFIQKNKTNIYSINDQTLLKILDLILRQKTISKAEKKEYNILKE